ncbi:MAG: MFS transporter, partial [Clostridia bacterium]|nr:MFS transporter [Clostridia bacterium]
NMVWLCVLLCISVLALCLMFREADTVRKNRLEGFDKAGSFWVIIFFTLVLCIPSFGQNFGWTSWQFPAVLISAAVSFFALAACEKKAENPILPGRFIMRRSFILAVIILFLTQGLMQANMTNTIVFVDYISPGDSLISGIAISVMYIGMSIGSVLLGGLTDRYEPKYVLSFSLILTAISCGISLSYGESFSPLQIALSLGILGIGLGGNSTGLMKVVLSGLPAETAGAGTGTYGLFRDLSAPFGVAVFVPLFTNAVSARITAGADAGLAAVGAMRMLSFTELVCVLSGIIAVMFLPHIHHRKDEKNEG